MINHPKPDSGITVWKTSRLLLLITAACTLSQVTGLAQTYELVHAFRNSGQLAPDDKPSQSSLIQAQDGYLYGTTYWGGTNGVGTVYRMDLDGNVTTIHSFAYADGANPSAALVQATDGLFYGVTTRGGAQNRGVVFRMDSSGRVTRLHSFQGNDGSEPRGALVQAIDGDLYGTTYSGGTNNYGTVFRIGSSGELTTLHSFVRNVDGSEPAAALLEASAGALYGTTTTGGSGGQGTVFRIDTGGSLTTVHAFHGSDGGWPHSGLIKASDGLLYGTTRGGGAAGFGTVFRLDALEDLTTLHSFDEQVDGLFPFASLVQATDGALYGTTAGNGYGGPYAAGIIFRITPSGGFSTVYNFETTNLAQPRTALVQASNGKLYGTTTAAEKLGGQWSVPGAAFRVEVDNIITVLHTFGWTDGAYPASAVTPAADGSLYGSTDAGGVDNLGTLWRLDPDGNIGTLHSFSGADGAVPQRIIESTDGKLYGSTLLGGWGVGTVFSLSPDGDVTPLHDFGGSVEGGFPSDLIEGSDGKFYGTCQYGGEEDSGFIFRIDDSGDFTVVAEFEADITGSTPYAGLLQGADGNFYGTTIGGGDQGSGTVFRLDSQGNLASLHSFSGPDGAAPYGGLMQANLLFGTTSGGGESGFGTVFRISSEGESFETIHDFTWADGYYPNARLVAAGDSQFLGTTLMGGQHDAGVVFGMDHDGNITFAHSLNRFDGFEPSSELVQASDGWFYGTARGGPFGDGVVFRLTDAVVSVNEIVPTSGPSEGGTVLDVLGGGFQADIAAHVGGVAAIDLSVFDPTFMYLATPALNPGTLNDVTLTLTDSRLGTVTATRANTFFADFTDVPQGDLFYDYVEKIFRKGITAGCVPGNYCPQDAVTRAQMAVFLLKSKHGSSYAPPPCTGVFGDVPCPSLFADWIEQLAAEGITAGCGDGNYCPGSPVTRAQMAVFLLKAKYGASYAPPSCAGVFGDVLCPSLFADWIEQLVAEQITAGCGGWNYCPGNPNTRAQMAAFLVKTFGM
jgi:uncharacterized repeat protein (TIGR03803 family)